MASEALKPCPFCGSEAEFQEGHRNHWHVQCSSCQASTNGWFARDGARAKAAALWNRRAPAPQWQPIETAPKDGTDIWVWSTIDKRAESIRFELYDDEIAEEVGEPGFWRYSEDLIADVAEAEGHEFSHWMPLPSSPRKEGSGDA